MLPPAVFKPLETVAQAYLTMVNILDAKNMTIARLRKMVFGPTSESSRQVLPAAGEPANAHTSKTRRPAPGHGRNGQADYPTAKTQKTYRTKETLPGGAILERIETSKALLRVDNRYESLSLRKFNAELQPTGQNPSIPSQ